MSTPKKKRAATRQARKALSASAPVVLLLPRHPDDFEPRTARAPRAPRRPPSRPAARPALPARPPVADGAPSKRTRAAVTTTARVDHGDGRVGRKTVDVTKPARVGFRTPSPREGGATRRDIAIEPSGSTQRERMQPSKLLPAGTSHRPLVFRALSRNRHALHRAAADSESPVSRRRSSAVRPPPAVPSNPCRSGRRSYILARGNRSKRYTKLASSEGTAASGRSVPLNNVRRLIGSIRATVRHLELLLLGGAA